MKKLAILSVLALCLGFTACDDDENVPGIPVNPQQPTLPADGVTVTASEQVANLLDLKALTDAQEKINVGTLSLVDFPENYDIKIDLEISKDENFSKIGTVKTEIVDNAVMVSPEDFEGEYLKAISKSPKDKSIYGRLTAYAINKSDKNNVMIIGAPGYNVLAGAAPLTLNVRPYPNDLVIEDAYYLIGTINGWDFATAVKFNHSEGVSGYDEPTFALPVDITPDQAAAGWWWKVIPASTYDAGEWLNTDNSAYGVAENGDEALSGMLVARTTTKEEGAGCVMAAGSYLFSINLEEGTYEFKLAYPNLWTPGQANGWSQASSQMLYTTDYISYIGYANLDPVGFKFTTAPDWDHVNFGNSGVDGELSTDPGAGNLTCPAAGLYHCTVDVSKLTYALYQVNTIGVIGDATPGGWNASTPLTPSADFLVWEGDIEFGTGEWKFRCNDDWAVNLGGDVNELVQDGANLVSPGAGVHHVTLDLSALSPSGKGYVVYID